MIKVSGIAIDPNSILNDYSRGSIEEKVINILASSNETYEYKSLNELKFELNLRKSIVDTAKALNRSGMKFKVFDESTCNTEYWERTDNGGFLLKKDASPSEAINDIFKHGSKYGTECSTAIIIIYYKAILNIYPEELFNRLFSSIHLMNWHYNDVDIDIQTHRIKSDYLPGDCRYFKNPEFNPDKSEWQGENVIDLSDGKYYGHGLGMGTADYMIKALNRERKPNAATSAYLTEFVTLPNFKHLSDIYFKYLSRMRFEYCIPCWRYFA